MKSETKKSMPGRTADGLANFLPMLAFILAVASPLIAIAGPGTTRTEVPTSQCGNTVPPPPPMPEDCEAYWNAAPKKCLRVYDDASLENAFCCWENSEGICEQIRGRMGCCRDNAAPHALHWTYFLRKYKAPDVSSACGGDPNQPGLCYPTW
jgi:hypothetical protein